MKFKHLVFSCCFLLSNCLSINSNGEFKNSPISPLIAYSNEGKISLFKNNAALPPSIAGINPRHGTVGSLVIITGSNFNASIDGNLVFFGDIKAKVISVSPNSLTVEAPLSGSCNRIIVLDKTTGLSAESTEGFKVTYESKINMVDGDFKLTEMLHNDLVENIKLSDIDGDGKLDMILVRADKSGFSVYRNISTSGTIDASSFAPKIDVAGNRPLKNVVIADLNGDGRPEVSGSAVVGGSTGGLSIFQNTSTIGNVQFVRHADEGFSIESSAGIFIDDIDLDGMPEVISFHEGNGYQFNFLSTKIPQGRFPDFLNSSVKLNNEVKCFSVADLDGDGKKDIALLDKDGLAIMINTSLPRSISFAPATRLGSAAALSDWLKISDIDGDGRLEIVLLQKSPGAITFVKLKFDGMVPSIVSDPQFVLNSTEDNFAAEDLNGDGLTDIAVISPGGYYGCYLSLLQNNSQPGKPSFSAKIDYKIAKTLRDIAAGDIDGDGRNDLVGIGINGNIVFLRNAPLIARLPLPAPPVITAFNPKEGSSNDLISIKGTGFSQVMSENLVDIGGIRSIVESGNDREINVRVPKAAAHLPMQIVNQKTRLSANYSIPFGTKYGTGKDLVPEDFLAAVSFNISMGLGPNVFMGDADGNGRLDFLDASIIYLVGEKNSTYSSDHALFRKMSDLNGDGKSEFMQLYDSKLVILKNNSTIGKIAYSTILELRPSALLSDIFVEDLTGDGRPDIILKYQNTFGIFQNLSVGDDYHFAPENIFDSSLLGLADFDGDDKPDIAAGLFILRNVSENNGIAFTKMPLAGLFGKVSFGDFDGDQKVDLALTTDHEIRVFKNSSSIGDIKLSPVLSIPIPFYAGSTALGDLNGDGKTDIAVSASPGNLADNVNKSIIFQNTSSGTISFNRQIPLRLNAIEHNIIASFIVDYDGDGLNDFVISGVAPSKSTQWDASRYFVYKSNIPHRPSLISFAPVIAKSNDLIRITGLNFKNVSKISFGNENALSFKVVSGTEIEATVGDGSTGKLQIQTETELLELPGFTFVAKPLVTTTGPRAIVEGGRVVLNTTPIQDYLYQWSRDGVEIAGATGPTLSTDQAGMYTVSAQFQSVKEVSLPVLITVLPDIPANNFKIKTVSAPCRGMPGGSVEIEALQSKPYTVVMTGKDYKHTVKFQQATSVQQLKAGNYLVCLTIDNKPDYKQCFEVQIAEPEALSLYSTVNVEHQKAVLQLAGAKTYLISLNGKKYQTTKNSIELPLNEGLNKIAVSSDLDCQGVVVKDILLASGINVYPNPVDRKLYIDMGINRSSVIGVEISNLAGQNVHQSKHKSAEEIELDLSQLISGVYILKLTTDKGIKIFKIIKK